MEWGFNEITIKRENYGENKGRYFAEITVNRNQSYKNEISFTLDEEEAKEILKLIFPDLAFALQDACEEYLKEIRKQIA